MSIWKEFRLYIQQVSKVLLCLSLYLFFFPSLPSHLTFLAMFLSFLSLDLDPRSVAAHSSFGNHIFKNHTMEISVRSVKRNLRDNIVQPYNFPEVQRW